MSSRVVNVGLIQAACSPDPAVNLERTLAAAQRAARDGAQIICTQELFRSQYFCQSEDYRHFQLAEPIPGPTTAAFQGLAGQVVLETTVRLREEESARLEEQIAEMFEWRQRGTPFNQPCCGSVFKNPVHVMAPAEGHPRTSGQFIDATGLKGLRVGGIEVSSMHANYFVNVGGGTAADVVRLMATVRDRVQKRWGVRLEPEVKLIQRDGSIA